MHRLHQGSSRNVLYSELGWAPLSIGKERQKVLLFYKIVQGIAPHYLQELLSISHGYNLRNAGNLNFVIPQTRTVSYYNSFLPSAIQLWNRIPLEIKLIESLHSF